MSELLPGLPDNVSLLCLARVPRIYHTHLRAVSKTWREVVGSKEFYTVREMLGVTEESVFLINKFDNPPGQLHCMEIDLKSKKSSKVLFVNDGVTRKIFNGAYGCASLGHLVLFFGGQSFTEPFTPSRTLYRFDTLSRTWTKGADMKRPRGDFCHGVIHGKLYIAGGYGGVGTGVVSDAEVYDADTDSWSQIASLPIVLHLDIPCVWKNKLVVRGVTFPEKREFVFAYSPVTNEWKEEKLLVNVFDSLKPLLSLATVVNTTSDDSLFVGRAVDSYEGMELEDNVSVVKVMKLDNETLKWKSLTGYRDEADEYNCQCSIDTAPPLFVFGLKNRVLVMSHLEYEVVRKFKLAFSEDMVKLYLECPSAWATTIVDEICRQISKGNVRNK